MVANGRETYISGAGSGPVFTNRRCRPDRRFIPGVLHDRHTRTTEKRNQHKDSAEGYDICYYVNSHLAAEPDTMAQSLSDRVLALPPDPVLVHEHTDEIPAETSGKADVEHHGTNSEAHPSSESLA